MGVRIRLDRGRYSFDGGLALTADATCVVKLVESDDVGVTREVYPSGSTTSFPGPDYVVEVNGGTLSIEANANSGTALGTFSLVKV